MRNQEEMVAVNPTGLVKLKKKRELNLLWSLLIGMVIGSFLTQDLDNLMKAYKKGYAHGSRSEIKQTKMAK